MADCTLHPFHWQRVSDTRSVYVSVYPDFRYGPAGGHIPSHSYSLFATLGDNFKSWRKKAMVASGEAAELI